MTRETKGEREPKTAKITQIFLFALSNLSSWDKKPKFPFFLCLTQVKDKRGKKPKYFGVFCIRVHVGSMNSDFQVLLSRFTNHTR